MRRLLLFAALLFFLAGLGGPATLAAQTAPPGPDYGDLVTIYDENNEAVGLVSVYGLYDPYEVVEPGNDPGPGNHFILMEAGFFNTGSQPLAFDPDRLLLVDANGIAYARTVITNLTASSTNYFQLAGTIDPGSELYGDNAYAIPDGTTIERVIYAIGIHHSTILDIRPSTVAPGTSVAVNDPDGTEVAQLTVNEVIDQFEAFDAANPPVDGARYVAVDLAVSNSGTEPLPLATADFLAVDDLGRLVTAVAVAISDPALMTFADGTVDPGSTLQGVIVYLLPAENSIRQLTFAGGGTRDLVIADLEAAGSLSDATGGCRDFANWAFDTLAAAGKIGTFAQNLQTVTTPETLDPGMVRTFANLAASIVDDQREVVPPPAVESVNAFFTEEVMVRLADSLDRLASALETGDFATAQQALDELRATTELFNPGNAGDLALQEMQAACPEEWEDFLTMGG